MIKALLQDGYWIWWAVAIPLQFLWLWMGYKKDKRWYVLAAIFFVLFIVLAGIIMYRESTS